MPTFPTRALALYAAKCCSDKGAEDIRVIELPDGTAIYDYIVLATANSDRQTHACVDEVYHFCKKHDVPRHPVEGSAGWMLIDCLDVVVHVLIREERERYELDQLWGHGTDIDAEAEVKLLPDPDAPAPAPEPAAKPAKRSKRVPSSDRKRAKSTAGKS
jgi:ribosome-associated protein